MLDDAVEVTAVDPAVTGVDRGRRSTRISGQDVGTTTTAPSGGASGSRDAESPVPAAGGHAAPKAALAADALTERFTKVFLTAEEVQWPWARSDEFRWRLHRAVGARRDGWETATRERDEHTDGPDGWTRGVESLMRGAEVRRSPWPAGARATARGGEVVRARRGAGRRGRY